MSLPAATLVALEGFPLGRAASAASPAAGGAPKKGGKLTAALPVDIVNFDAYLGAYTHMYMLQRALFNTLTHYNDKMEPQPELATEWKFSADGLSLALQLRKGVKFHSGREFSAEDVLFSLAAMQDAKYGALQRGLMLPLKAEAKDKFTVVFSAGKPYAAIFDALDALFIVDKETAAPRFPQKAIGTGPFKQGQWVPGDFARFDRFDGYWGGPAHLDTLEVRPMPDLAAMAVSLETGAIDVAWRLNYQDYVRLRNIKKFQMLPGAEAGFFYDLTINTTTPAFKDKRVRQAINWAVDRKRFVEVVLRGVVEPTSIPYPRASVAYDADLAKTYAVKDLARAKDLIAQAGFPRGFEATLMTSQKRNPGMIELAQILQADLKTIGVNLKIEDLEPPVYDKRFVDAQFEIAVHTFGRANKDPGVLFGGAIVWYTDPKRNPSRFQSDRYTALVSEGSTTLDRAKRKAIYREITQMILDECWCIAIAEQPRVWGVAPHVKNFAYSMDNNPLWHGVWMDK
jgi:peptide/nickel transport system substrate-binding protein